MGAAHTTSQVSPPVADPDTSVRSSSKNTNTDIRENNCKTE